MAKGFIQIISPDPVEAGRLEDILVRHGHEVVMAASVEAVLAQEGRQPDMILLDLTVGVEDGMRFIRGIRDKVDAKNLPVIVIAEGESGVLRLGEADLSGGSVLRKSESAAELADKVRIILEMVQLRQNLARSHAELRNLNLSVTRLLEMKNKFLSLATHDIRTPITTMKLVADVLEKQLLPEAGPGVRRLLDILERNVAKIEGKIEELLLISRLDMEEITLELREVDLNAVVQDAIAGFHPGAISRSVDIDAQFGLVPPLRADPRRLGQLAAELIACSLERLDAGQYMIVETTCRDGRAVLSVCDNGPVIMEDQVEDLMKGLREEDPNRQTRASLYYAYQIAKRHGGTLEVSSDLNAGTIFAAVLPMSAHGSENNHG